MTPDEHSSRSIHLDLGDVHLDGLHARAAGEIEAMTGEDIEDVLAAIIKTQLTGGGGRSSQIDRVLYGLRQQLMHEAGDPGSTSIEDLKQLASDREPGVDQGA